MYQIGEGLNNFLVSPDLLERRGDDYYMPNFPGFWVGMSVFVAHTNEQYTVVNEDGKLELDD